MVKREVDRLHTRCQESANDLRSLCSQRHEALLSKLWPEAVGEPLDLRAFDRLLTIVDALARVQGPHVPPPDDRALRELDTMALQRGLLAQKYIRPRNLHLFIADLRRLTDKTRRKVEGVSESMGRAAATSMAAEAGGVAYLWAS